MKSIEKMEEYYTSAYCRLSYDIWYQDYRDNLSKHLHSNSLDIALSKAAVETDNSKVIRIDGVFCKEKYGLKECIDVALHFLYIHKQYAVIVALPYDDHKEADRLAYEQTNKLIDIMKFSEEMHKQDYLFMIWSITRKPDGYLKIHEDATVSFAIYDDASRDVSRGNFFIKQELYKRIVNWAKKYIEDTKMTQIFEGMSNAGCERFQISFVLDKLGFADCNSWYIPRYRFEKIEGNGVITELLKLPELKEFIREGIE